MMTYDDFSQCKDQKVVKIDIKTELIVFLFCSFRTSQSGNGEFHFLTQNGRDILECVKSHTRRLHQGRTHDDSPRSTPLGVPSSLSSSAIMDSRSRSSSNNSQSLSLRPADSVTSRSSKSS